MANKAELIARLEEAASQEDVEQAAEAVETLKEAYEALIASEHEQHAGASVPENAHSEEAVADGGGEAAPTPIESAAPRDEEDKRFKQLLDAFNQRVNDIRRKKAKEEADNLGAKKAVLEELKDLIAHEENIGNAFKRFAELQDAWKAIGPVPQQAYRELQSDYSHLRDEFYHHINIYKELRDHDLRKNTALKQALVSDMAALATKDDVRELERMVKEYQEKWHQVGPVTREERENVRDAFWDAVRAVYEKIHEHYKARRAEHEANLQAKQDLVAKVAEVAARAAEAVGKEWKALTDQVLELQNAWKNIGFATKKDNERVWKEFRAACNTFFDARKAHHDKLRDQHKEARDRKQALLEEALVLKDSTEWRRTADRLKVLQQQWKEAGSAGPRDENKLWQRFREACDGFFQARKATFEKLDAEQAENAKEKEALIAEIEAFQPSGERGKDMDALKAFSERWLNSGRLSPRQYDAIATRYRAALDKQYGQLRVEGEEFRKMRFKEHVNGLRTAPDAGERIEREQRAIKRRIEELETEKRQMEGNMGMFSFKSASGEAMKKDMERKIDRLGQEVERLREQEKELRKELQKEPR